MLTAEDKALLEKKGISEEIEGQNHQHTAIVEVYKGHDAQHDT